ncbi:MAG: peptidoglycan-binding domain-containing protein, partial [Bacillota bacterium]
MKRKFSYPILLMVLSILLVGLLLINREVASANNDYNFKLGTRELEYGAEGVDVLYLQIQLKVLGYYDGTIDGLFGRGTLRAVKQFQESRGIKPHGIIDAQTVQYLDSSNY